MGENAVIIIGIDTAGMALASDFINGADLGHGIVEILEFVESHDDTELLAGEFVRLAISSCSTMMNLRVLRDFETGKFLRYAGQKSQQFQPGAHRLPSKAQP